MSDETAKKMNDEQQNPADQDITMEESFARLNEVLDKIETGELPLEEVFALYQEGLKLVRICEGKIDRIDKQLKILNGMQPQ